MLLIKQLAGVFVDCLIVVLVVENKLCHFILVGPDLVPLIIPLIQHLLLHLVDIPELLFVVPVHWVHLLPLLVVVLVLHALSNIFFQKITHPPLRVILLQPLINRS